MRALLTVAAAAAALNLLWSAAGQSRPSSRTAAPSRLIGVGGVGGLPLRTSFKDAVYRFGRAGGGSPRERYVLGGCSVRFPKIGLLLWYAGDPLAEGTLTGCDYFSEAVATGAGWHTRNGLTIGDSTARLLRLFPHAYDTRHLGPKTAPQGSVEWDITITCCGGGERPALSVMVKRRRVVAFRVAMVGH